MGNGTPALLPLPGKGCWVERGSPAQPGGCKTSPFPGLLGQRVLPRPQRTATTSPPWSAGTVPSRPWATQAGATWMNRLSWVFCCSSRVFSCSKEKMYSAVCWRMAACRRAGRGDTEAGETPASPQTPLLPSSLPAREAAALLLAWLRHFHPGSVSPLGLPPW